MCGGRDVEVSCRAQVLMLALDCFLNADVNEGGVSEAALV